MRVYIKYNRLVNCKILCLLLTVTCHDRQKYWQRLPVSWLCCTWHYQMTARIYKHSSVYNSKTAFRCMQQARFKKYSVGPYTSFTGCNTRSMHEIRYGLCGQPQNFALQKRDTKHYVVTKEWEPYMYYPYVILITVNELRLAQSYVYYRFCI
jgi:hypothetical protein